MPVIRRKKPETVCTRGYVCGNVGPVICQRVLSAVIRTAGSAVRRPKFSHRLLWALLACLVTANAQISGETLFAAANQLQLQADNAQAGLLSPEAYQQAVKLYSNARRDFAQGKSTDRVSEQLDQASAAFTRATKQASAAGVFFAQTLDSRTAAGKARAEQFAERDWSDAEDEFRAAIKAHERGKLEAAQRDGMTATELYRTAELEALRSFILSPARATISDIRRKKLNKWVPVTLSRTEKLLQRADELLRADRTALDAPKALSAEAQAEAERARSIATLAEQVARKETSVEALVLSWQDLLADIAQSAEVSADPADSPAATSAAIIAVLEQLPGLRSDLADREALVIDLEEEIRELDDKLGGASDDRSRLIRRLEQQERVREQFAQVEDMFGPDEAIVLREGGNLIIRLVGMNFASNSATLSESGNALLDKVHTAIDVFPQCDLSVEGHTDSSGNTQRNRELSEERALAVKTHMIDAMRIPAFRIQSSGYGDTRPIASNRTGEGRTRNRRIDLIIAPNAASF